jgi:transcriptional regulator with XRE-family HTH domain
LVSLRQIKAARALLAWSQQHLAEKSGVSYPTIARLEALDGAVGGHPRTEEKIIAALQKAGVEFTNGGQPGVKLRFLSSSGAAKPEFEPFKISKSSDASITIETFDGEMPIRIVVEKSAIDSHFGVPASTRKFRREIVEANLNKIKEVAIDLHRQWRWTKKQSAKGMYRRIVIRNEDLNRG